jgi:L-rhamnose mutarotase
MRVSDAVIIGNIQSILNIYKHEACSEYTAKTIHDKIADFLFVLYKQESIHDYDIEVEAEESTINCMIEIQHDYEGPYVSYSFDFNDEKQEEVDPITAYERAMTIL